MIVYMLKGFSFITPGTTLKRPLLFAVSQTTGVYIHPDIGSVLPYKEGQKVLEFRLVFSHFLGVIV